MGAILSRFKKQESTKDTLERIQQEIEKAEEYKWFTLRSQRHLISLLTIVFGIIYILSMVLGYIYYLPKSTNYGKIVYILCLVVTPFIIYALKRCLQSYYVWLIEGKEDRIRQLKKEKKKILDNVMETETYKVAKELLEKYDPARLRDNKTNETNETNKPTMMSWGSPGTSLVQRNTQLNRSLLVRPPNAPQVQRAMTPMMQQQGQQRQPLQTPNVTPIMRPMAPFIPSPRLSRPILPQQRTIVEKFVDYVVGDGPANRYGLICRFCHSHNGMALQEEFDYLAFRCCYCFAFNPARKLKPNAPRIAEMSQHPALMSSQQRPVVEEPSSDDNDRNVGGTVKIEDVTLQTVSNRNADVDRESIAESDVMVDDKMDVQSADVVGNDMGNVAESNDNETPTTSQFSNSSLGIEKMSITPSLLTHPDEAEIMDIDKDD